MLFNQHITLRMPLLGHSWSHSTETHFWSSPMLFTNSDWEDFNPYKRTLLQPLRPWRCIGWSDLTLNFLVVASPNRGGEFGPDGWIADGPEALIELVQHLGDVGFSVHLIARKQADASMTFCQVTGLWREVETGDPEMARYWYSTDDKQVRPCAPLAMSTTQKRPKLVKLLSFGDR
jgi:hypothetical protein